MATNPDELLMAVTGARDPREQYANLERWGGDMTGRVPRPNIDPAVMRMSLFERLANANPRIAALFQRMREGGFGMGRNRPERMMQQRPMPMAPAAPVAQPPVSNLGAAMAQAPVTPSVLPAAGGLQNQAMPQRPDFSLRMNAMDKPDDIAGVFGRRFGQ